MFLYRLYFLRSSRHWLAFLWDMTELEHAVFGDPGRPRDIFQSFSFSVVIFFTISGFAILYSSFMFRTKHKSCQSCILIVCHRIFLVPI
ncbi:hypothetical protein BDR03DRAFT_971624 [Suillus americanus]|nr:hypothetical protein BDR03DRAFT_971624 [Suillus americanus]